MNLLKRNIISNLIGNVWSAILSLSTIPIYIHFMGIESYGLIGFSITLMAFFTILDVGITQTISREMARLAALPEKAQEMRNLVRTLEVLNWIIAISIGVLILCIAEPIALYWIQPDKLDHQTVYNAVILMGLSMMFQWPSSFYSSGLIGLQKQVLLNVIISSMTTLRCAGAVLILWMVSPTINAFFIWQFVIYVFQTTIMAFSLWSNIPKTGKRASFQVFLLNGVWRFAVGMGGITITALIMSQADKFILSKLLTLEAFGYYSLAVVVATSFSRLMGPLVTALYPRLTQLLAMNDNETLKQTYHGGCQLMSVLIMPVAFFMAFFAQEILLLWTQSPTTAENIHLLITFLAIGAMFNGLTHIPLSLYYAYGKTGLIFCVSAGTMSIMIPAIFLMTKHFGALGATVILMVINLLYMATITQLIHRHILPEEKWRWGTSDVGLPLIVALISVGIGRIFIHETIPIVPLILELVAVAFITLSVTALTTPITRNWMFDCIVYLSRRKFFGNRKTISILP